MKTQTHTPWIAGRPLIKQSEILQYVNMRQVNYADSFNAGIYHARKAVAHSVYVADQFIIGMIRSANCG